LAVWERAIGVEDVFRALSDVKHKRHELDVALVLVAVIAESARYPDLGVREALANAMPLISACCEEMFVAVEGSPARRELFRSLFFVWPAMCGPRKQPHVLGSVDDALVRARSVAPHDVLGLQQRGLRHGQGAVRRMA
jgi:hypothetical protein